jgi:TM2 domain-containing membrane protein YozV
MVTCLSSEKNKVYISSELDVAILLSLFSVGKDRFCVGGGGSFISATGASSIKLNTTI